MSDSRRPRRPEGRHHDDSDRRDRYGGGARNRDRDRERDRDDRRGYRSRSRERRGGGGHRDRSRSPDRRHRDRDDWRGGRDRGGGGDRDRGPRGTWNKDSDRRDGRRRDDDYNDERDSRRSGGKRRGNSPRRSRSPPPAVSSSNSGNLPTRPHPNNSSQNQRKNMSFNVGRRSGSPSSARDVDTPMREESRGRERPEDDDEPEEDEDPDMAAMKAMMGFGGFDTTKNKKVSGNNVGGLRKEKKSEYRQYMNRQGGFNRPLSPSR